jgi:hypothetical protein
MSLTTKYVSTNRFISTGLPPKTTIHEQLYNIILVKYQNLDINDHTKTMYIREMIKRTHMYITCKQIYEFVDYPFLH